MLRKLKVLIINNYFDTNRERRRSRKYYKKYK